MQRKLRNWKAELYWTKYRIFALCKQTFFRYITWNLAVIFKLIREDKHLTSIKIIQFSRPPPPCPSTSKIHPPPWPCTSNFKRTPPPLPPPYPLQYRLQSVKRKHNPRMTIICYQQSLLILNDGFTVWRQS